MNGPPTLHVRLELEAARVRIDLSGVHTLADARAFAHWTLSDSRRLALFRLVLELAQPRPGDLAEDGELLAAVAAELDRPRQRTTKARRADELIRDGAVHLLEVHPEELVVGYVNDGQRQLAIRCDGEKWRCECRRRQPCEHVLAAEWILG